MPALIGTRRALLAPSKGVLWNPLLLSTALVAWWDASQGVAQSAGLASAWTDRIGGLAVSQATGANQLAYSATARNGKPGLISSSSNQVMSGTPTGLPSGTSAMTIATQAYRDGTALNRYTEVVRYGTDSGGQAISLGTDDVGNGKIMWGSYGVNPSRSSVVWGAADRTIVATAVSGTNYTPQFAVDGSAFSTGDTSLSKNIGSTYIRIGNGGWPGVLQDIMIGSRVWTQSEADKVAGWLSWNRGLNGSNLPSGHAYKNRPPYVSDP